MKKLKKYIEMHNRGLIDDQEFIEKVKKHVKIKEKENHLDYNFQKECLELIDKDEFRKHLRKYIIHGLCSEPKAEFSKKETINFIFDDIIKNIWDECNYETRQYIYNSGLNFAYNLFCDISALELEANYEFYSNILEDLLLIINNQNEINKNKEEKNYA